MCVCVFNFAVLGLFLSYNLWNLTIRNSYSVLTLYWMTLSQNETCWIILSNVHVGTPNIFQSFAIKIRSHMRENTNHFIFLQFKVIVYCFINWYTSVWLEKAIAPHSSTFAWKIPWMKEPGRLQSMGLWRVGHNWAYSLSLFTFMHWRRKWQPTPVFLPGES